jgi:APA family basic amino acid/polyamine antiporter
MNKGIQQNTGLERRLDVWDTVSLVAGSVIGSGIFLVPHQISLLITSPLLVLAVWAVAGAVSLFGALAIAEMSSQYPHAGGLYIYLREAFGPGIAFLYGWSLLVAIQTGNIAGLGAAFSIYLRTFVSLSPLSAKLMAMGVIGALTLGNCFGIRRGASIHNVFTVIKLGTLACVIVLLIAARRAPAGGALPLPIDWKWSSLGLAAIATLWAYEGWHLVTFAAGEVRDPERTLPRGLILGVGLVIVLYLAANGGYLRVLPIGSLQSRPDVAAAAMESVIGRWGGWLVALLILFSIAGAMNGLILSGPRVYFAMARDGLFFRHLTQLSRSHHAPVYAIILQGLLASIMLLAGEFAQLITYVIFAAWIFYALTVAGVWILRRSPAWNPPFRCPAYPLLGCVFVGFALYIMVSQVTRAPRQAALGVSIILLGLPVYWIWSRRKNRVNPGAQA